MYIAVNALVVFLGPGILETAMPYAVALSGLLLRINRLSNPAPNLGRRHGRQEGTLPLRTPASALLFPPPVPQCLRAFFLLYSPPATQTARTTMGVRPAP